MSSGAPTQTWHLPGVIRGLALLACAAGYSLVLDAPGEHPPIDTALTVGLALAVAALAVRVALLDGREPSGGAVFVLYTRMLNNFSEVVIAGMGALLLLFGTVGLVSVSSFSVVALFFGITLGGMGTAMTLWRPCFVLDAERKTLRRYPFGRALPLRVRELPYYVRVTSEAYYSRAGNVAGVRTGDVIRGMTRGGSFELEFVPGNDAAATEAAVKRWREIFGELGTAGGPA